MSVGFSHDLNRFKDNYFDCVIVSFVFHWIDRSKLFETVSEIDRVLTDGGFLIIQDFSPKNACKTKYHHLENEEVYTYKQNYWDIFFSSNLYNIISHEKFLHNPNEKESDQNMCSMVVMKKNLYSNYPLAKI